MFLKMELCTTTLQYLIYGDEKQERGGQQTKKESMFSAIFSCFVSFRSSLPERGGTQTTEKRNNTNRKERS